MFNSIHNGSFVKPLNNPVDLKAWDRCNDLVCSWILYNLDDTICKSVLFFKTAREIWCDLEDRFGYTSMTQVYSLEQQLSELNQGSKTVSDFFTEIKTLWDAVTDADPLPCCTFQKCTCGLTQRVYDMQQNHKLLQFMMKLNDKFSTVRGNLLMQQPLPNLASAFRVFSQEERHQNLSNAMYPSESLACAVDNKRFGDSTRGFRPQGNF